MEAQRALLGDAVVEGPSLVSTGSAGIGNKPGDRADVMSAEARGRPRAFGREIQLRYVERVRDAHTP